jgi:hypothetical protein
MAEPGAGISIPTCRPRHARTHPAPHAPRPARTHMPGTTSWPTCCSWSPPRLWASPTRSAPRTPSSVGGRAPQGLALRTLHGRARGAPHSASRPPALPHTAHTPVRRPHPQATPVPLRTPGSSYWAGWHASRSTLSQTSSSLARATAVRSVGWAVRRAVGGDPRPATAPLRPCPSRRVPPCLPWLCPPLRRRRRRRPWVFAHPCIWTDAHLPGQATTCPALLWRLCAATAGGPVSPAST